MKRIFTFLFAIVMAATVWAIVPQTISYQAVVRNHVGQLMKEIKVGVKVTILHGSESGSVVYEETRVVTTNKNGLLTFAIGDENGSSRQSLSDIDWSDGIYFIRCDYDLQGGGNYEMTTSTQIKSVPYALYAERVSPNALPQWVQSEEKPTYNYVEIVDAPTVPTKVSELENDAKYITLQEVPAANVPTKLSELTNDAKFITKSDVPTKVSQLTNDADYAKKSELPSVPTKVSELTNDKSYITAAEVPTVSVPIKVSDFENDAEYITESQLESILTGYNILIERQNKKLDSLMNLLKVHDMYDLTLLISPADGGTVMGSGSYVAGNTILVVAEPFPGYSFRKWSDGGTSATRNIIISSNLTLTAIFEKDGGEIIEGALPGEFSVSATKKVRFSKGNLQYQASTGIWRFAENQYDVIGEDNLNISASYNGWIDLFGWGTSGWNSGANAYQPYSASRNYSDYFADFYSLTGSYANADWGIYNKISNGGNVEGKWHTLSNSEWKYLFEGRANSSKLRGRATVNGVYGFIFLPDNWSLSNGLSFVPDSDSFSYNSYTISEWMEMESEGAVFLPSAGMRTNYSYSVKDYGYGHYWSNRAYSTMQGYIFGFNYSYADPSGAHYLNYGLSVRLVQE